MTTVRKVMLALLVLVVGGAADLGTSVAAVKDCLTQRCI